MKITQIRKPLEHNGSVNVSPGPFVKYDYSLSSGASRLDYVHYPNQDRIISYGYDSIRAN